MGRNYEEGTDGYVPLRYKHDSVTESSNEKRTRVFFLAFLHKSWKEVVD